MNLWLYRYFLFNFSVDLHEKEIEIKLEISKKAGLLKKPVRFTDVDARIDEAIPPNENLWNDYIDKNPVHRCIQVSAEMSHHEVNWYTLAEMYVFKCDTSNFTCYDHDIWEVLSVVLGEHSKGRICKPGNESFRRWMAEGYKPTRKWSNNEI